MFDENWRQIVVDWMHDVCLEVTDQHRHGYHDRQPTRRDHGDGRCEDEKEEVVEHEDVFLRAVYPFDR